MLISFLINPGISLKANTGGGSGASTPQQTGKKECVLQIIIHDLAENSPVLVQHDLGIQGMSQLS